VSRLSVKRHHLNCFFADLPYAPPFDFNLPDYTQLGKALLDVTRPYHVDDSEPQLDYVFDSTSTVDCRLPLPRLGEDEARGRAVHRPNSTTRNTVSSVTTRRGRVGKSDDLIISFDVVGGSARILDDFQFDV
jgi:hypothetical protein